MGFPRYISVAFLVFLSLFTQSSNCQIVFKELPGYHIEDSDSTFFDINQTRYIIPLDGTWQVYSSDDKEKNKVSVQVPSLFKGNGDLIFEKEFSLSKDQIFNHKMKIEFLGLNYTADISINGVIIYRHSGGEFPFKFDLPRDILHSDKPNLISVRLYYKLDSQNTIPLKQRFLFPQSFGGILRDVYIKVLPNVSISDLNIESNYDSRTDRAKINVFTKIDNREQKKSDSTQILTQFSLRVKFISPGGVSSISSQDYQFQVNANKEQSISQSFDLTSPMLWSPTDPQSYLVDVEVWSNGNLIDKSTRQLAIYELKADHDSLTLNGKNFMLNGVTYVPSFSDDGSLATYSRMEDDIKMIKELGFNSVRFAKSVPHPYYLAMCEKYGLLAFIEMPVSSIPDQLAQDLNFITRCKNYLTNYLNYYKNYSAVAGIGLGGSYLPGSDAQAALLKTLTSIVKNNTNKLTYASFSGFDIKPVTGLDLYGVELFNKDVNSRISRFKDLQTELGAGRVFISSATYVVNMGNSNGYVNQHSFEAQAKYFENLIDFSNSNPLAGYFINTMFDYRGDYASLVAGYNKDNIYEIGISGEDRSTNRLGYKVIYSKLHNSEKVTIPIGSEKDNSPMIFVISGLLLALIMGVLVNSGRKFREDCSRALLRPYNFFADVRDQRIMSGYHSTLLAVIIAAISALTIDNLLFYVRESVVFEKVLLSFGSKGIMKIFSYLAWHPTSALIWLTAVFVFVFILLTVFIKAASFFVRNNIFTASAYFTVIWSFLPLVLLIPVGIVLYRALSADIINIYIYIVLAFFILWVFYRLIKGVYVIFDVNPGSVYFYSILIILIIVGGFLLIYQMKNSVIDYLQLTFKQYNILG